MCGTFYSMIGICFTYQNLLAFFKKSIAILILAILILGTNYFYYSVFENGMTHTYLFTMYAAAIYYTIKWHQEQKVKYAVWLGAVIGLAIVIRPSEILIILIPILWNIKDGRSLTEKLQLVYNHILQLLILSLVVIVIGSLQLAYWKYSSGHWLYNSYKEAGLYFDFLHPNLLKGIFSLRKGWLIYSPVMILSFIGLYFLYRNSRKIFLPVVIYMFINIYVVFSWCQWDYGGGFGSRPLVQSYAVLILPMGFVMNYLLLKPIVKYCAFLFIIACSTLNLMQTTQYAKGLLSPGGLNSYSYHLLFGKLSVSGDDIKRFEKLDIINGQFALVNIIKIISFDTLTMNNQDSSKPLTLTKEPFVLYNGPINSQKGDYIMINGRGKFDQIEYNYANLPAMKLSFLGKDSNVIAEKYIKIEPLMNRDNTKINVDYLGDPGIWTDFDFAVKRPANCNRIRLTAFNPGYNQTMIENLIIKNIVR